MPARVLLHEVDGESQARNTAPHAWAPITTYAWTFLTQRQARDPRSQAGKRRSEGHARPRASLPWTPAQLLEAAWAASDPKPSVPTCS